VAGRKRPDIALPEKGGGTLQPSIKKTIYIATKETVLYVIKASHAFERKGEQKKGEPQLPHRQPLMSGRGREKNDPQHETMPEERGWKGKKKKRIKPRRYSSAETNQISICLPAKEKTAS